MDETQRQIDELVKKEGVVLFMKGTRQAPQCGFSAKVVDVLDEYLPEYVTVNVLAEPAVRSGIKEYSSWPTIPQLYVKGEFVGGCDIVLEMASTGELDDVLGVKRPELRPPEVFVTEGAVEALAGFHDGPGKPVVRLEITSRWQYGMDFDQERPGDVKVEGPKWIVVMNRTSAKKADGMTIDYVKGPGGEGFKIENPNEPPRVKLLEPKQLAAWMEEGKPMEVIDVRTPEERATAKIEGTRLLDDEARHMLEELEKTHTLVFYCHSGMRSQRAAEQAIAMGFTDVYNLAGGIDAWSREVDSSVPRY